MVMVKVVAQRIRMLSRGGSIAALGEQRSAVGAPSCSWPAGCATRMALCRQPTAISRKAGL